MKNNQTVKGPFFTSGSGYFEVNPIGSFVYFWAANKHGSENNTYPYFEDEDIQHSKDKAERICASLNNYERVLEDNKRLLEALKRLVDYNKIGELDAVEDYSLITSILTAKEVIKQCEP